jgi:hypothetical protein
MSRALESACLPSGRTHPGAPDWSDRVKVQFRRLKRAFERAGSRQKETEVVKAQPRSGKLGTLYRSFIYRRFLSWVP